MGQGDQICAHQAGVGRCTRTFTSNSRYGKRVAQVADRSSAPFRRCPHNVGLSLNSRHHGALRRTSKGANGRHTRRTANKPHAARSRVATDWVAASGRMPGGLSGNVAFILQNKPVGSKIMSAAPWNEPRAAEINCSPKPRLVGGATVGPPLSRHSRSKRLPESDQRIDSLPAAFDRAPYFAALVANS